MCAKPVKIEAGFESVFKHTEQYIVANIGTSRGRSVSVASHESRFDSGFRDFSLRSHS
jgi:hypothetical protein